MNKSRGKKKMPNAREKFSNQKSSAKFRGIDFHFTFEQWCSWWEEQLGSNWLEMLGCRRGQYVMARNRDMGAYELGNVRCVLSSSNHRERNKYLWMRREQQMREDPKFTSRFNREDEEGLSRPDEEEEARSDLPQ